MTRFTLAAVLTLATGLLGVSANARQGAPVLPESLRQMPAFRAGVDLVALSVTVTDASHRYVGNLEASDFTVFEDGVSQDLTLFNPRREPISLSLLLDSSASMEQHLPMLQSAATRFVQRLNPGDLVQVIDFDNDVEIRQAFTANPPEVQGAIARLTAGGSTALYNAVYIALRDLQRTRAMADDTARRQGLIVFSDGEDTSSVVSFDDVLNLAKQSDVAIYAIALRGPGIPSRSYPKAEWVMQSLAQATGGRAFFPTRITDLSDVYGQIADDLASQYMLGYTSKNPKRDGRWRRVAVQVSRPNVVARTRTGYYAPTMQSR